MPLLHKGDFSDTFFEERPRTNEEIILESFLKSILNNVLIIKNFKKHINEESDMTLAIIYEEIKEILEIKENI